MSQDSRTIAIPRIIHQIWYQGADAVPDHYRAYADGWKRTHPGWEYRHWDETSCRALLTEQYPEFLPVWERYPLFIQRIDAIRYFILNTHGGIYLDMDMECLKPIDSLLEDCDLLLSQTVSYNNAVMASIPGHEFWKQVLSGLVVASEQPRPRRLGRTWGSEARYAASTAGPLFLGRMVQETGVNTWPRTRICPGHVFEPYAPVLVDGRLSITKDTSRSHAIHHEALGWLPSAHRYLSLVTRSLLRVVLKQRR